MTEPGKLPYFTGSVDDLRKAIAFQAYRGEQRFGQLTEQVIGAGDRSDEAARDLMISNSAAHFGWTIVAWMRRLREINPSLVLDLASMMDDIGTNGGNDYCEDIPYPPIELPTAVDEPADPPVTAASTT